MPHSIDTTPGEVTVFMRSQLYKLLSLGFRHPNVETFFALRKGDFVLNLYDKVTAIPHLKGLVRQVSEMDKRVRESLVGVNFQDFETAYIEIFDVGMPAPPCPPYEGLYRGTDRAGTLVEVSEFYKNFGLAMDREEGKRALPDHISAELEFMHFLTFKEVQARMEEDAEHLKGYMLAQRDFLERHLLSWMPKFCDKLGSSLTGMPLFCELAAFTLAFLAADLEWVRGALGQQ